MIDARILAVQGVGYAPFAMAVQGALTLKVRRTQALDGGGPDEDEHPAYDWRYGLHPALRRTGDHLADLKAHLMAMTAAPLPGATETDRQVAKLARTVVMATPAGVLDVPVFKPMIRELPADLTAGLDDYAARTREEVIEERRRILLLLAE